MFEGQGSQQGPRQRRGFRSMLTPAARRDGLDPAQAHALALAEAAAIVPVDDGVALPAWAHTHPGVELAVAVGSTDPDTLDDAGLIELVAAWDRLRDWVEAGAADTLARFAHRRPTIRAVDPDDTTTPDAKSTSAATAGATTSTSAAVQGEGSTDGQGNHYHSQEAAAKEAKHGKDGKDAASSKGRYVDRGLTCDEDVSQFVADEVSARLGISVTAARTRLTQALSLTSRHHAVLAALTEGLIDPAKAHAFTTATRVLDDPTADLLVLTVLPEAPRLTLSKLKTRLTQQALRLNPDAAAARAQAARADRRVRLYPGENADAALLATGPADDTIAVYSCLDLLARYGVDPTDERSMDQRRFDALTWAITTHPVITGTCICQTDPTPGHGHCPGAHAPTGSVDAGTAGSLRRDASRPDDAGSGATTADGRRAHVGQSFFKAPPTADTAAGAAMGTTHADTGRTAGEPPDPGAAPPDGDAEDRQWAASFSRRGGPGVGVGAKGRMRPLVQLTISDATALGLSDEPGYLHGYGYVPADLARRIAADADWRRLLTDPVTGAVVAMDTTAHDPPASMAALVIARDRTCRFPTCNHRAETCDLDHGTAWPQGRTTPDELLCECRPHHRLKHLAGWRLTRRHGHWTWISPTGHCYRLDPVTIGIVTDAIGHGPAGRAAARQLATVTQLHSEPDPDTITEADMDPPTSSDRVQPSRGAGNAPVSRDHKAVSADDQRQTPCRARKVRSALQVAVSSPGRLRRLAGPGRPLCQPDDPGSGRGAAWWRRRRGA